MVQLPMRAFTITGDGGDSIALTIDEVIGFPGETHYAGGYGAIGTLVIRAGACAVNFPAHSFTTGELYRFYTALEHCYKTLSGTAVLENTEQILQLQCEVDYKGHITVTGTFQANPVRDTILHFSIDSDQTALPPAIRTLKAVCTAFGDNLGCKNI